MPINQPTPSERAARDLLTNYDGRGWSGADYGRRRDYDGRPIDDDREPADEKEDDPTIPF
jgi:hypothetical protein